MSRIQNILDKAERDGTVQRVRGVDHAGAALANMDPSLLPAFEPVAVPPPVMLVDAGRPAAAATAPAVPALPPIRIVTNARLDARLIPSLSPASIASEQYRALRTRILHADNGSAVNVVMITSPGRGDGKTITAGNLALAMAQEYQHHICLVDADLRQGQLQRLFGLPDGPGLSDVLAGQASIDDALLTIEEHHITILPAGRNGGRPAELLGTTAMRRVIDTLRTRFDRVIVDAPAAVPLADVGILTPLVDSVLLVVRSGATSKPAIHDAVSAIDGAKLLGLVLNDAN